MKHIFSYDGADSRFMVYEGLWDNPDDTWEDDPGLLTILIAWIPWLIWKWSK